MKATARTLALFATATAIYACSSSNKARSVDAIDGGSDASVPTEDSGKPGSGGRTGAGGAPAIEAGAGGSGTGGSTPEASVPDANPDANDAAPPFVCTAPTKIDGGVLPDGAPADPGQWRDFDKHLCVACPAAATDCDSFDSASSTFDKDARVLRMVLKPSINEIVSGTVFLRYGVSFTDGGYDYVSLAAPVPVTVEGNTLVADLSTAIPHRVFAIYNVGLNLTDACGQDLFVEFGDLDEGGDAAKPTLNLHCEQ